MKTKGKKHEDTKRIARTYRTKIENEVSKALKDDDINETEFTDVVKFLGLYYDEVEAPRSL